MVRKKIVAANWKMNLTVAEGEELIHSILRSLPFQPGCDVVVAPPFTHLQSISRLIAGTPLQLAAQHCHEKSSGAYTGEISAGMLSHLGVVYIIAGHSERREIFNESNELVRQKVDAIFSHGMTPVFCCGERLEIRQAGHQNQFVSTQISDSVFHLTGEEMGKLVIAYEPVWAIGTGMTASPEQAQEMHFRIRRHIEDRYGAQIAQRVRILYGGSIKAENAASIFKQPDVDGGLVGGASLQAVGFSSIIEAAC